MHGSVCVTPPYEFYHMWCHQVPPMSLMTKRVGWSYTHTCYQAYVFNGQPSCFLEEWLFVIIRLLLRYLCDCYSFIPYLAILITLLFHSWWLVIIPVGKVTFSGLCFLAFIHSSLRRILSSDRQGYLRGLDLLLGYFKQSAIAHHIDHPLCAT